jgi:hypothetical protein
MARQAASARAISWGDRWSGAGASPTRPLSRPDLTLNPAGGRVGPCIAHARGSEFHAIK